MTEEDKVIKYLEELFENPNFKEFMTRKFKELLYTGEFTYTEEEVNDWVEKFKSDH